MNEDFYYSALDEEIHKAIVEKELKSYTGVSKYKVFPLSQIEARKYFEKNPSYVSPKYFSAPTKYAMSKAKEIPKYSSIDSGIIRWWLYTNSKSGNNAALSGYKGNSYFKTDEVLTAYEIGGYRPAIWIDLSQAESFIYK